MADLMEDQEFLALVREAIDTVKAGDAAEITVEKEREVDGCTEVVRFEVTRDPFRVSQPIQVER